MGNTLFEHLRAALILKRCFELFLEVHRNKSNIGVTQ